MAVCDDVGLATQKDHTLLEEQQKDAGQEAPVGMSGAFALGNRR
jgi:hypothetical protein